MQSHHDVMNAVASVDGVVGERRVEMRRRWSMPQHSTNQTAHGLSQGEMSTIDRGGMMTLGEADNEMELGSFQCSQALSTIFPTLDTCSLNISNPRASCHTDRHDYSTMPPDLTGRMATSTFANLNAWSMSNFAPIQRRMLFPANRTSGGLNSMDTHYSSNALGTLNNDFRWIWILATIP
jgi:hypothetical protein